jgi:hypothetical protein
LERQEKAEHFSAERTSLDNGAVVGGTSPSLTIPTRRTFSCIAMVAMMEITASLKIPVESRYRSEKVRYATVDELRVQRLN